MNETKVTERPPVVAQVQQRGLFGVTRQSAAIFGGIIVLVLTIARFSTEFAMMAVHGPDAQMAIWWAFCVIQVGFWMVTGGVLVLLLYLLWNRPLASTLTLAVLLVWAGVVSWSSWSYMEGARALADGKNPKTSPQRLHELVDFRGIKAGYQLDNFIASNPNTSAEDLRALAFREHQSGTDMLLAANPSTPVDILEKLLATNDTYVWNGLARNPRLPKSIEEALAKSTDPDIQYLLAHRGELQR